MHVLLQAPEQSGSQEQQKQIFEALKDDDDLKEVFEDVKANGPAALQK